MIGEYRQYIVDGNIDKIKELLNNGWNPGDNNNLAISLSVLYEQLEIFKTLIQDSRVDPSTRNNYQIRHASSCGNLEMVKLLLRDSRVDPGTDGNTAIKLASYNGHLEVVKLLLKDSRVKMQDIDKNSSEFNKIVKINREVKLEKLLQHVRV